MTSPRAWMETRRPRPPGDLAARLGVEGASGRLDVALAAAADARLGEAAARTGRVRESAFRLLEADAFLTYACEAALETEDPEVALRDILASTKA